MGQRSLKSPDRAPAKRALNHGSRITNDKLQNRGQRGYLLITLMLAFALMAIALAAIVANLKQQIQRDREAELQHRGTMYMRAIQHYYRKFNRYPTKLEDLENTNQMRFLRRRYKDPMSRNPETGGDRDFKLLHMQDVTLNNGPLLGQMAGAAALAGQAGLAGPGGLAGQAGLGGAQGGLGGAQNAAAGLNALGQMSQMSGLQTGQTGLQSQSGSSQDSGSNATNGQGNSSGSSNSDNSSGSTQGSSGSSGSSGPNGQTFGGGPILGVASMNKKDKTIRIFNKKEHYNDWLFIYDPSMDKGGLLTGPWQPLTIAVPAGGMGPSVGGMTLGAGQSGVGGAGTSQPGFGQSPGGFGQQPPQNPPPQSDPNQNSPDN